MRPRGFYALPPVLCMLLIVFAPVAAAAQSRPGTSAAGDAAPAAAGAPASAAEETARVAILDRGPKLVRGIRYLDPNALSVWEAVYRLGDRSFDISYTREPIVPSAAWQTLSCGSRPLMRIPEPADPAAADPGSEALLYRDPAGWSLFFSSPQGMDGQCAFIQSFIQRFLYFMSISASVYDHPFPAIVRP